MRCALLAPLRTLKLRKNVSNLREKKKIHAFSNLEKKTSELFYVEFFSRKLPEVFPIISLNDSLYCKPFDGVKF